jgi:hypothetical protein
VFTLPPQLAALALQNKKMIYALMLRASAETLLEVARNPRHLGAEIGFFSVLHTWNQKLQLHPHVHCVVPAGGLALDHTRWIRSHPRFFLPIPGSGRLAQPKFFAAWLRPLFRKNWVVYSKPPFGGPSMGSTISAVTPIASPSPIIDWSRWPTAKSPFVGATRRTTTSRNS